MQLIILLPWHHIARLSQIFQDFRHTFIRFGLDEKYLLSEDCDDDELDAFFEDEASIPDDLFYSFYYYSKTVLSQVPDIIDKYGKFAEESAEIKSKL